MGRKTSKTTVALLIVLFLAAAATKATSQEAPKLDLNALALKGEAIASADPLSAELRNRQPDDSSRRGFDIGMAAAEGQTLPGTGKQKLGASLPPAEQSGFNLAVSFSLERNRNADLAARGAAIARVDEKVAAARTAEADVFYWLGFDIATGIFGDPALGAKGNTAVGPGSLKIRDALSPAGQKGFNASMKLHLGPAPPSSTPRRRPRTPTTMTPIARKTTMPEEKELADINKDTAPAFNELRCRGGAGLRFVVIEEEGRTNSSGEQTRYMTVLFEPAAQAASSGRNLQPGQCAFTDRALRANEPNDLFQEIIYFGQLRQQLHGTPVDTSPTAAERYPDAQNVPRYLADAKHYWSFFVRQNAPLPNGRFEASHGRYWKPGLSNNDLVRPVDSKITNQESPYVLSPKKP
jgi:hypothetical protein